jgi:hypothetical protein
MISYSYTNAACSLNYNRNCTPSTGDKETYKENRNEEIKEEEV